MRKSKAMKSTIGTLLLLLAVSSLAQSGWKKPESIHATISEYDGVERTYEIFQKEGSLTVLTSRSAFGALEGIPRFEAITKSGVFTWLADKPNNTLLLQRSTVPNLYEFLATPRFSRADLEFNLNGIQKALGKTVRAGRTEKVAARDCLVLTILDRPDSAESDFQRIWVDIETGLTLKQEDYFAGKLSYSREFASIQFNSDLSSTKFAPSEGDLVIKGPVSPETLLKLPDGRPHQDFIVEIKDLAKPKEGERPWTSMISEQQTLRYAQTTYREQSVGVPQTSQNRRGNSIIDPNSGGMFHTITNLDTGDRTLVVAVTAQVSERPIQGEAIIMIRDAQGNILQGQSERSEGFAIGQTQGNATSKTVPVIKSDFVDPATGHTFVFIQVKGSAALPQVGQYVFGQPTSLEGLPSGQSYSAKGEVDLTIVTWTIGDVQCAIASTSHTVEQLVAIAKSAIETR